MEAMAVDAGRRNAAIIAGTPVATLAAGHRRQQQVFGVARLLGPVAILAGHPLVRRVAELRMHQPAAAQPWLDQLGRPVRLRAELVAGAAQAAFDDVIDGAGCLARVEITLGLNSGCRSAKSSAAPPSCHCRLRASLQLMALA